MGSHKAVPAQRQQACKETTSKTRGAAQLWGAPPRAASLCPASPLCTRTSPQQGLWKTCCLVLLCCLFCCLQAGPVARAVLHPVPPQLGTCVGSPLLQRSRAGLMLCCKPNMSGHPVTLPPSTVTSPEPRPGALIHEYLSFCRGVIKHPQTSLTAAASPINLGHLFKQESTKQAERDQELGHRSVGRVNPWPTLPAHGEKGRGETCVRAKGWDQEDLRAHGRPV